ncbi:hypothetical protein BH11BAC5_BH11BAC5_33720 [soil metagenome]
MGDYMIDDHLKNLDNFKGVKLLFTATHNTKINSTGYRRVNDWWEVQRLLTEKNECEVTESKGFKWQ